MAGPGTQQADTVFTTWFRHLPQYRIVVCVDCRIAVVPKHAAAHLARDHGRTTKEEQRHVQRYVDRLQDVAHSVLDVRFPAPEDPPYSGIAVRHNGLRCSATGQDGRRCRHVVSAMQKIQEHCREAHGWRNEQRRGGNVKQKKVQPPNRMWDEGQAYQQFFTKPSWKRNTPVTVPAASSSNGGTRQDAVELFDQLLTQREVDGSQRRQRRTIQGEGGRQEVSPWLRFVAWHVHLAGFDRGEMLLTIRPAVGEAAEEGLADVTVGEEEREDSAELAAASRATRRLIRRAFKTAMPGKVGRPALEAVNRRETGERSNEKPFYAGQKVATIRKYSRVWIKVLRYIWRTEGRDLKPDYELTPEQAARLGDLQRSVEVDQVGEDEGGEVRPTGRQAGQTPASTKKAAAAEEASLAFWIAMFDHELKDREFESGIISAAAVLGLEVERGGWRSALSYTPMLSAIITTLRALVVYWAYGDRQRSIEANVRQGLTEVEARQRAPAVVDGVDTMVKRFMTIRDFGGRITPMDRLLHQRTYGMRIRYTTKAEGMVSWNGNQVLIDDKKFDMDGIRTVVHGLVEAVKERLHVELMFADKDTVPVVDIGLLVDNPAETSEGWSFLNDTRNVFPVDGRRWMWRRLAKEEDGIGAKFVEGGFGNVGGWQDIHWKRRAIKQYFQQVRRFKEELMVLVHLSAGAPARATELLSIRHTNGVEARNQRGVFIDNGTVSFVTAYHKGFSASQKAKIIHRYVPREVGELVVQFLWLIQPFVEQLQAAVIEEAEAGDVEQSNQFQGWMWEPHPEEDWAIDEDEEATELGGEADKGGKGDNEEEDGEAGRDGEDNGTGGEKPQKAENVDGFWDTNRVRRIMGRETERRIGVRIGVALWRQAYPAIQRELCRNAEIRRAVDEIYEAQPRAGAAAATTPADIRAQQAGHGRYMEEMIYGLLITESPFTTASEKEQFHAVSNDWHRLLQFNSAFNKNRVEPGVERRMAVEREVAELRRYRQMRDVDIDVELVRFYGSADAVFRGIQEAALRAIIHGNEAFVLAIMPTGGGKSLLFMLPAAASRDGVTIVIVPMVALRQDMCERSNKKGVPCAEWDGKKPPYHARIILATPESAVTPAFGRFIEEKKRAYQLERIVIDECHMILESTDQWRPKVRQLKEMAGRGVQMLYLTATLPPSEEAAFHEAVGVPEREMFTLRDCTVRPNIAYAVIGYKRKEEDKAVRQLVEEKLDQHPEPGQVIVYCRKVEQAKKLAAVLGCSVYHRTVGDQKKKKGILQRLTGQTERVFTATNALGIGIDAPTIRTVIHVGVPKELKQYSQESGRAGRDGQASEAIIMQANTTDQNGRRRREVSHDTDIVMKEFVAGKRCRRAVLDGYIDGQSDRRGCEEGEQRCDVCQGITAVEGRQRVRVVSRVEEDVDIDVQPPEAYGVIPEAYTPDGEEDRAVVNIGVRQRHSNAGVVEAEEANKRRCIEESEGIEKARQTHKRQEQRRRNLAIEGAEAGEKMEGQYRFWQERCEICQIYGRVAEEHASWRECPDIGKRDAVKQVWEALGEIRFEPYTGCFNCWAPQSICAGWETAEGSGQRRYKRVRAGQCQFPGVLRDTVAAAVGVGRAELIEQFVKETAAKERVQLDSSEQGVKGWMPWLRGKARIGEVETSGLGRIFWELQGGEGEVE